MPRQCIACISPHRAEFEAAVAGGQPVLAAAKVYGIHRDPAYRHIRQHDRAPAPGIIPGTAAETFLRAFGHTPMPWQQAMLTETRDTLLLKGRQTGATEAASALAIHTALTKPGSTSAIISPSQRQSSEVTVRARIGFWNLGERLRQDSATLLRTANGSRVLSLPGSARGIRGYAADLVVLDEAAWINAETFAAARPLTAATNGRTIVQSTPGSPVGAFYEMASDPPEAWAFMTVRSDEVATISPDFLARERREMAAELYAQEYEATFGTSAGGLFDVADIRDLFRETA